MVDGDREIVIGRQQPRAPRDDPMPIVIGIAGEGDVEAVPQADQPLHRIGRRRVHPDAAVPIHRHEPERLIHHVAHDRQIEMIAVRDGSPIVDAGPAERVHAQAQPRALDRLHIDDISQIADVRVEIVVPVRRGGAQRLLVWDAFHTFEAALHQLIRPGFDPAGDAAIGRSPSGGVVLEAAVVRRIVRRRDDNAVGQPPARAPAVVAQDGVRYRGRRCVCVLLREHDVDAVGREHLDSGGAGRHRQGMRVEAEKERTTNPLLPAVAADGLADREHVPFVEGLLERRPAMARRAEGDALGGH